MVALVILFPQMVMVYKSGESTVDPSKVEFNIQQEDDAPPADAYGQPAAPPTEGQKQDKADDAAQSLQDAFKAPAAVPPPEPAK